MDLAPLLTVAVLKKALVPNTHGAPDAPHSKPQQKTGVVIYR
jgi:hypothetical protein